MALRTDREKTAHLLRRFGLGASEAELNYYAKDGLKSAIDKLLNYENTDEGYDLDPQLFALGQNGLVVMPSIMLWWNLRLMATRRPLQEKMTVFWHDHFATSAAKVVAPPLMLQQNNILRQNATGNFKTLLTEVSKDPAMLFWLDNQYNVKGKPNENFAREVMELFTLGIGHYTEKDIQEAARAFTGWTIGRNPQIRSASFRFAPGQHDDDEKTIFGKTGNFGGEDVIDMLCDNPQTARYITTKIWEWFAYENPEPSLIERLSSNFHKDLEIKNLLRAIMESAEFYSVKAERSVYKNPVDFVIPTVRQLGVGPALVDDVKAGNTIQGRGQFMVVNAVMGACQKMGMQLLYPPDVSGWDGGAAWVTSATMVNRMQWGEILFGQIGVKLPQQNRELKLRMQSYYLFEKDPTPEGAVKALVSVFDANVPAAKEKILIEAADKACGGKITSENANATAAAVCKLMFGLPEFQFC